MTELVTPIESTIQTVEVKALATLEDAPPVTNEGRSLSNALSILGCP